MSKPQLHPVDVLVELVKDYAARNNLELVEDFDARIGDLREFCDEIVEPRVIDIAELKMLPELSRTHVTGGRILARNHKKTK